MFKVLTRNFDPESYQDRNSNIEIRILNLRFSVLTFQLWTKTVTSWQKSGQQII